MPEPKQNLRRNVKLGINPFDLANVPGFILGNILKDPKTNEWRITQTRPIIVDKARPDEQCVEFVCSLITAALCIDLLRNEGRQLGNGEIVRAYLKREAWARIPHSAILTRVEKGTIILNERWFPIIEEAEPIVAKPSLFIMKGKKG
jgi:hypothetical protein